MKSINKKKTGCYCTVIWMILLLLSACRSDDLFPDDTSTLIETPDWTSETHGSNVDPNYELVFKQDEVLRIDIVIEADDWITMQNDLQSIFGSGRQHGTNVSESDPVWVPCSVFFNSTEWYKVGIRYKGNSSLSSTYQRGISKLSFKLDFDQFEETYSSISNQRFYGFKQLNLKNNFEDYSFIREKVTSDLFLKFGIASPETAFCRVYVDYGSGVNYFGLYTLVEEVDDTVIKTQFSCSYGNLYKPDGTAASFASGSYKESEMEKKNNEEIADYSDVYALYAILNSSSRASDAVQWRTNLDDILDTDIFLKWLAANTVVQNWDTYGKMTHNYYLYNSPENGLLTWIPWDNNEALKEGKQGGALSISLDGVNSNWPLIRYLIDQSDYQAKYRAYLKKFVDEVFVPDEMTQLYSKYYEELKDYAYAEESGYSFLNADNQFDEAIESLKAHVSERNSVVLQYLE